MNHLKQPKELDCRKDWPRRNNAFNLGMIGFSRIRLKEEKIAVVHCIVGDRERTVGEIFEIEKE